MHWHHWYSTSAAPHCATRRCYASSTPGTMRAPPFSSTGGCMAVEKFFQGWSSAAPPRGRCLRMRNDRLAEGDPVLALVVRCPGGGRRGAAVSCLWFAG